MRQLEAEILIDAGHRQRKDARLSANDCMRYASRQASLNSSSPTGLVSPSAPTLTGQRHPVALRPDQLLSLAQTLNVSVDDLVGTNGSKKRASGPTGNVRQLFEAASRLPRSQQQKITALLEPFMAHHAGR